MARRKTTPPRLPRDAARNALRQAVTVSASAPMGRCGAPDHQLGTAMRRRAKCPRSPPRASGRQAGAATRAFRRPPFAGRRRSPARRGALPPGAATAFTIRRTLDCLIASVCIRQRAGLLHADSDLDRLAACTDAPRSSRPLFFDRRRGAVCPSRRKSGDRKLSSRWSRPGRRGFDVALAWSGVNFRRRT
jgi:hypothetical protein